MLQIVRLFVPHLKNARVFSSQNKFNYTQVVVEERMWIERNEEFEYMNIYGSYYLLW